MRQKIHNPAANFVVGKFSTGIILSEWTELENAAIHSKQIAHNWEGETCPYAVYTREEWEGGYKT